jgi:hypothetical protein
MSAIRDHGQALIPELMPAKLARGRASLAGFLAAARRRAGIPGRREAGRCAGSPVCAKLGGMGGRGLDHVRTIALALPGVTERLSHGAPCFFVRDSRPVCYYHDDHRSDGRESLWCPAPAGVQDELVSAEPERFFRPPVSARGTFSSWLGVYLGAPGESSVDWTEIAAIVEEAYRLVAPRQLVAELDSR